MVRGYVRGRGWLRKACREVDEDGIGKFAFLSDSGFNSWIFIVQIQVYLKV